MIEEKIKKFNLLINSKEKAWFEEEKRIIEKRLKWIKQNRHKLKIIKGNDVEKAYKLFYLEYLNVKEKEIEIVEKSEKRIVLRSYNFCPVLEACKKLNLDTRIICKKLYEKPTQVFIQQINPNLKFKRNYEKIRPYTPYCEETIEMDD